jgi:hypothetical protein
MKRGGPKAASEVVPTTGTDDTAARRQFPRETRSRRWHRQLHEHRAVSHACEQACRHADGLAATVTR